MFGREWSEASPKEVRGKCVLKNSDKQFAEYTEERDGSRIVKTNVHFDTPSGAAQFCVGGSSNGWSEWKDEAGQELKVYRE